MPHLDQANSELIYQPPISTLMLHELQECHHANLEENKFVSLSSLPHINFFISARLMSMNRNALNCSQMMAFSEIPSVAPLYDFPL